MRTLVAVAGLAGVTVLAGCAPTVQVLIAGETVTCQITDTFKVIHAHSELKATPDCLQAPAGAAVKIKFVNPIDPGKANTMGGPMWLDGKDNRGSAQEIPITIGPGEAHGAAYKFTLVITGIGTLDPRIVVQ